MERMTYPKRVYTYRRKLYLTTWSRYEVYPNKVLGGVWHCMEEKAIFIGFKDELGAWFSFDDLYYDGHTCHMITLFGICFGKIYSYDARPFNDEPGFLYSLRKCAACDTHMWSV